MIFKGIDMDRYFKDYPDEFGYFGKYGGVYITEELKNAIIEDLNSFIPLESAKDDLTLLIINLDNSSI